MRRFLYVLLGLAELVVIAIVACVVAHAALAEADLVRIVVGGLPRTAHEASLVVSDLADWEVLEPSDVREEPDRETVQFFCAEDESDEDTFVRFMWSRFESERSAIEYEEGWLAYGEIYNGWCVVREGRITIAIVAYSTCEPWLERLAE